jgi:hypothetical protein
MNLTHIENLFRQQQQLLGNLADEESFHIIFTLIEEVRQLSAANNKLTSLNRHYFFKFYDGSIDKMLKDNDYLIDKGEKN